MYFWVTAYVIKNTIFQNHTTSQKVFVFTTLIFSTFITQTSFQCVLLKANTICQQKEICVKFHQPYYTGSSDKYKTLELESSYLKLTDLIYNVTQKLDVISYYFMNRMKSHTWIAFIKNKLANKTSIHIYIPCFLLLKVNWELLSERCLYPMNCPGWQETLSSIMTKKYIVHPF